MIAKAPLPDFDHDIPLCFWRVATTGISHTSDGGFSPFKQQYNKKKFFSFFTLTPSQIWLKRPVYRGFKGEGKCEGRTFTLTPALTLPSHFRHRKVYCQGFYLQNLTKVPEKYSYLVPTVQHRYTNSIAMPDYQYSYAALSVQGCCTFGARMLHFYWHYYSKVFTPFFLFVDRQYQRRIKSSFFILLQQDLSMRV